MRFMITCRVPVEKGNELAKNGTLGETIQTIMEELQPEAAYFSDIEGARGGYIVVNMDDASQIPAIAEPLFLGLGATIQVHPVMTDPRGLGQGDPGDRASGPEVRLESSVREHGSLDLWGPGRSSLGPSSSPYSPECVEGVFFEV